MQAELETLLKADEEARARVRAAQSEAEAEVHQAEQDSAARRASSLESLRKQLDLEVAQIHQEASAVCEQRRKEREEYLRRAAALADSRRQEAIDAYVRLIEQERS